MLPSAAKKRRNVFMGFPHSSSTRRNRSTASSRTPAPYDFHWARWSVLVLSLQVTGSSRADDRKHQNGAKPRPRSPAQSSSAVIQLPTPKSCFHGHLLDYVNAASPSGV